MLNHLAEEEIPGSEDLKVKGIQGEERAMASTGVHRDACFVQSGEEDRSYRVTISQGSTVNRKGGGGDGGSFDPS